MYSSVVTETVVKRPKATHAHVITRIEFKKVSGATTPTYSIWLLNFSTKKLYKIDPKLDTALD